MKRNFLFNLPYYIGRPPNLLWSRGWYGISDIAGDGSILYRAQRTERRTMDLKALIGKAGLIWLRLGSSAWHKGKPADVITFANQVSDNLGGNYVLVTTDGDMSVPGELPIKDVEKILADENLKAWFTQNYDGSIVHPKLKPIPVGLDLHTGSRGESIRPKKKTKWFIDALNRKKKAEERINKIWSDVHFKRNPGRHGDPRGDIQEPIGSGRLESTVDTPHSRLSHKEIWSRYGEYQFVLSLPGAAVEAHRTWEALALGAVVITVHTSLDDLLRPYRVIFLDQTKPMWWARLGDKRWLAEAATKAAAGRNLDLSWEYWEEIARSPLAVQNCS